MRATDVQIPRTNLCSKLSADTRGSHVWWDGRQGQVDFWEEAHRPASLLYIDQLASLVYMAKSPHTTRDFLLKKRGKAPVGDI